MRIVEFQVRSGDIAESAADVVVVNLFEGVTAPSGATGAIDRALDGALSQAAEAAEEFAEATL